MDVAQAVCIIEKDTNADVFLTWMYPNVDEDFERVLIKRSLLSEETIEVQFIFSKYKNEWHYLYTILNENQQKLPRVVAFSICIISKVFCPEKYLVLGKLFAHLYTSSGSPLSILDAYLGVVMDGKYEGEGIGLYEDQKFDARKSLLVTSIKDLVKTFGLEVILIWTALMMKKRIIIYSEKLSVLLRIIRGIPVFVWHRQNWNILRPFVTLTNNPNSEDDEIQKDLLSAGVYVAGFIDANIKLRQELYDLFIDLNAQSITISEQARADFVLGSLHKDIANFLVDATENDASEQEIIKGLAQKTKDLLTKLDSLKVEDEEGNSYITYECLQQRKLGRLDRFLFNVAAAEGMTKNQ